MKAYTIKKNAHGERFVFLTNGDVFPADIAGSIVGLADIKCKCRICNKEFPLRELYGGGQWCEECQSASVDED